MLRNFRSIQTSAVRHLSSKTKYTGLSNGLTVATQVDSSASSATVGLWVAGGSRSETPFNNGVSALISSTLTAAHESAALSQGVLLTPHSTKEITGIYAQSSGENALKAASVLASIFTAAPKLDALDSQKKLLAAKADQFEDTPYSMVLEHLDATAFQGTNLALPTIGTSESISGLAVFDAQKHYQQLFVSGNAVVVASGNVDHEKLVETLEKEIKLASGLKYEYAPASFLGSEVRIRDDTLPKAYIAIAAKGEAIGSDAYYVAKVASAVNASYSHADQFQKWAGSKLSNLVGEYHIVDSFNHFSKSYADAGLWGFSAEISNVHQIDDLVHFTLMEWNRLSVSITETEISRAKNLAKRTLLQDLLTPTQIAQSIATNTLTLGFSPSVEEALAKIDAVSVKDVKSWANETLWNRDIAISGTGQIEGLFDYNRIRNDMSMMRW